MPRKSNENKLLEKRGQGTGKDYKPWLRVHEVPSKGLSSRIIGTKTGRIHQLLSQLETAQFFLLEWDDNVRDIREQFPLLPIQETTYIAEELKIKHPWNPRGSSVLTTDFLITLKNNLGVHYSAIAVKPKTELSKQRTLEKLEIERIYWLKKNIPWQIV